MRRLLIALLLLCSGGSWAACTVSTVNASFGSVTSFALSGTGEVETTGTLVVTCDTVLNLLTNDSVTLNYTSASVFANSRATMKRTDNAAITDVIPTRLCGASGCGGNSEVQISKAYTEWKHAARAAGFKALQHSPLFPDRNGAERHCRAVPVLLTFSINYNVCAVGAVGACLTPQTGTATTSILVNMTVTNDCSTMTTPDVNFNSAPLVQNFPTVSQSVAVTCTKGSTYTIGINNGANALNNVRRMVSGSNFMSYDIYKEATSNRWGSSGSERWASASSSQVSTDGLYVPTTTPPKF